MIIISRIKKDPDFILKSLITLVLVFFSILVLNIKGTVDVEEMLRWIEKIKEIGIVESYHDNIYPPLSYGILGFIGIASEYLNIESFYVYKFVLLLFFYSFIGVTFYIFRTFLSLLISFSLFIFSSLFLGYIDIYFAPLLLGALYALYKEKLTLFSVLYTLSCFMKPQPILLAPFFLIYLLKFRNLSELKYVDYKKLFLKVCLPALLILLYFFVIFGTEVFSTFKKASTHYQVLGGLGFNFNWILQYIINPMRDNNFFAIFIDTANQSWVYQLPKIFFYLIYAFILIMFIRKEKTLENLLLYSLVAFMTYFMFNIRIHENHMILTMVVGLFLYKINPKHVYLLIYAGLLTNLNQLIFYGVTGNVDILNLKVFLFNIHLSVFFSVINFLFYIYLFYRIVFKSKDSNDIVSD